MPPPSKEDQLYADIVGKIRTGDLRPGQLLPSTREIIANSGMSYTVVRGAMRRLVDDGWVDAVSGRGRWVAEHPPVGGPPSGE